ncbi:hypothetical protein E2C01_087831 [Portunus trituberculatus]|uniref:Uncharacterized protein n=1 Tax=Portunus trituberculatus TaxID=210409 RepID=A0A5B7JDJ6_PORTR|nr:hypothetical protein [Portunus trituberculatus]
MREKAEHHYRTSKYMRAQLIMLVMRKSSASYGCQDINLISLDF